MDAGADQVALPVDAEPAVGRAQREQHGVRAVGPAVPRRDAALVAVDRHRCHLLRRQHLHAEAFGLPPQSVRQVVAGDALGEAREVVEPLGDPGLTADAAALDHQHAHPLAGGVERCRQPGRAGPDDDEVVERPRGLGGDAELRGELGVARLHQHAAVVEDDRRDHVLAVVVGLHNGPAGRVAVDVHVVVGDALLVEQLLGALAVRAPAGAVQGDGHAPSNDTRDADARRSG